jgi:hypothetical protein
LEDKKGISYAILYIPIVQLSSPKRGFLIQKSGFLERNTTDRAMKIFVSVKMVPDVSAPMQIKNGELIMDA